MEGRKPTVVLVGTFDTKGDEYGFLQDRLHEAGVATLLVDAGVLDEPTLAADVSRETVARAGGRGLDELRTGADRGDAVEVMSHGAVRVVRDLHAEGRLQAVVGLGGSGGSSLVTRAMRALPMGVPKLMVSTRASGDVSSLVGAVDLTMMHSVVDIAGLNRFSRRILSNAAAGIAAMAWVGDDDQPDDAPLVGATMFGNTMGGVTAARRRLEQAGQEVVTFHATGVGGEAMETLLRDDYLTSALDLTTSELAAELLGSPSAARPGRLEVAVRLRRPQVVSLGALDMAMFGPPETLPERLRGRRLYQHNPDTTLVRTTAEDCAELARRLANRLAAAPPWTSLLVPLRGFSLLGSEGQPFHDPDADRALIETLRTEMRGVAEVRELDTTINDPTFGVAAGEALLRHHAAWSAAGKS